MADAIYQRARHETRKTAAAAIAAGEVHQLADGRAAVYTGLAAAASGDRTNWVTEGKFKITKAASVVILDGAPIYWDHSANAATCVPQFADRDFFLGTADGDVAGSATTLVVNLNVRPQYIIDLNGGQEGGGGGDTAIVLTAGTPYAVNRGGMLELAFSATAEAQKADWLSRRSFPVSSNWIFEGLFEVVTDADADVADLSIGVANGTHASDFESVAEFVVFHLDNGADLNIDCASDDGTTDVNPTDSTIDFAVGTPVHVVIDGRDPSDCQLYIDGILVLGSTTFTLAAATGPLRAVVHLEKSSNDSPGVIQCDMLRVRIAEQ